MQKEHLFNFIEKPKETIIFEAGRKQSQLYSNIYSSDIIHLDPTDDRNNRLTPHEKSDSFSEKKLSNYIELYRGVMEENATLRAQADLNARRAGQAEVRAETAEFRAAILTGENDDLREELERTRERLDHAFANEQRLLTQIDSLRRSSGGSVGAASDWAKLGLDPNIAFVGLTQAQRHIVLDGAFRTRSRIFHPDQGGDEEEMKQINLAYERLKARL